MTLDWAGMFCFVVGVLGYQLGHYRGWRKRGIVEQIILTKELELAVKRAKLAVLENAEANAKKLQARQKPWDCEHGS